MKFVTKPSINTYDFPSKILEKIELNDYVELDLGITSFNEKKSFIKNKINNKMSNDHKKTTEENSIDRYKATIAYLLQHHLVENLTKEAKIELESELEYWLEDLVTRDISEKKKELEMFFDYQQQYLALVREYKEEIKFLNSAQEDLRKERSKFFAQTLQEVNVGLKNSSIDEKTSQKWTQQLVDSYTNSLNVSQKLVDTQALNKVQEMKMESEQINDESRKQKSENAKI